MPPRLEYQHSDNVKKILICALITTVLAIAVLSYALHKESAEKSRYKANQTALLADVEYYRTESGKNAASVQKLTLSYDELKKNYADVCRTAEELDLKVKRLQSVSNTATRTEVEVRTVVKDSIVYREGRIDSLLAFRWADTWVEVSGEIERDSVSLDICSTDTLMQFVHRVPHKFLFFKWGCKAIRQEIVSKNPHTKIIYTDYLELN